MRLSTSTNIMDRYEKVQGAVSMDECLCSCAKAGYAVIDMNFHDMSNPDMPLSLDTWESWVDHVAKYGKELGLEFSQSHSHFYHFLSQRVTDKDWHEELIRRSFIGSSKLNIPWMVMHTATYKEHGYSFRKSKECNLEKFKRWLELAYQYNVGIAIENLYDPLDVFNRTFSSAPEELIELVDELNDEKVGICWDTGHANLNFHDQCDGLRMVGHRLVATHINDNDKVKDRHLLPYYGVIEWEPIVKTLKEIEYKGDFTFEITPFLDRVPPAARQKALEHTVEVGKYLISLAK